MQLGNTMKKILYYCLGLGASTPLLALVLGGRVISLVTVCVIFVFIDQFTSHKFSFNASHLKTEYARNFMKFMYISLASCVFGFIYFIFINTDFAYSSISFIPKILIYLVLFCAVAHDPRGEMKMKFVFEGAKLGIFINLLWAIVDAFLFYTSGYSLTNSVFVDYITAMDYPYGQLSTIETGYYRSAGLNNDQSSIGTYAITAVIYSFLTNKRWLSIIGVLATMATVSFIGIAGVAAAFFWQLFLRKGVKHRVLASVVIILTLIVGGIVITTSDSVFVMGMRAGIEARYESKSDGDHSSELRSTLIKKFPACVASTPTALFIGTGYNSAVYPYYHEGVSYMNYSIKNPKPTAVENTFVEYFFDLGLFGFLSFFLMFYQLMKRSLQNFYIRQDNFDIYVFAYLFGALFSYLFYHNILYSLDMLVFIASILYLKNYSLVSK